MFTLISFFIVVRLKRVKCPAPRPAMSCTYNRRGRSRVTRSRRVEQEVRCYRNPRKTMIGRKRNIYYDRWRQ